MFIEYKKYKVFLIFVLLACRAQATLCDTEIKFNFNHLNDFKVLISNTDNKVLLKMFQTAFSLADRKDNLKSTIDLDYWIINYGYPKVDWQSIKELNEQLYNRLLSDQKRKYELLRKLLEQQFHKQGQWNEWPLLALVRLLQLIPTKDGYLTKLKENSSAGLNIFPEVMELEISKEEALKYLQKLSSSGLLKTKIPYDPASVTKRFFDNCPDVKEMMIAGGHIYEMGADQNEGKFVVNIDPLRAPDVTADIYDEQFISSLPKNQFTKIIEDANFPDLLTKKGSNLARALYETLVDGGELISLPDSFVRSENNDILLQAGFKPVYFDVPADNKISIENNILEREGIDRSKWDKLEPPEQLKLIAKYQLGYSKNLKIEKNGWQQLHHFKKEEK